MITKRLPDITITDLENLIASSVRERKTLELKQSYSLENANEKGEFLADVSSFANASGGDLVFGIKEGVNEEAGTAKELTPFLADNIDAEKQKIENLLRDGISPRLKLEMEFIAGGASKFFLILRIQKSWLSPHRVIFNGCSKTKDQFYTRNSNGKYQLDVGELRNAFTMSDTLIERIKRFRVERISAIIADETPIPMCSAGKIILHIVPLQSFNPEVEFNMKELGNTLSEKLMPMFINRGWDNRLNFDGFVTFAGNEKEKSHAYTQFYRSGIIEAVDAAILDEEWAKEADGNKYLHGDYYVKVLIESLNKYLCLLQELGVNPPFVIFITITGAKDFAMGVSNKMMNVRGDHGRKIDRDVLDFPEHMLENYDERAEDILRPIFDIMWNACGFEQVPYFDANGNCTLIN